MKIIPEVVGLEPNSPAQMVVFSPESTLGDRCAIRSEYRFLRSVGHNDTTAHDAVVRAGWRLGIFTEV